MVGISRLATDGADGADGLDLHAVVYQIRYVLTIYFFFASALI